MVVKNNLIGISGKIGAGKDLMYYILNYLAVEKDWDDFDHFMSESIVNENIFKNKKFAGKLKDIVSTLIGCDKEQLEHRDYKEKELGEEWWQYGLIRENTRKPILYPSKKGDIEKQLKVFNNAKMYINKLTPRKLLQLLGTECGRQIIHPNIWVNALFANYKGVERLMDRGENRSYYEEDYPNWIITDVRFPNEVEAIENNGGIVIRIDRKSVSYGTEFTIEHDSETVLDDYEFDYVIKNNGSIDDLIEEVKKLKLI
tara:strand:- start:7404 stop:8174 length:771 start_codon:yes stop_codon:yes gene_type:complete